jgi:hypothetical protein
MTAAFNNENVNTFLNKVLSGSAKVTSLPKSGIVIKKTSKWDGKDAKPIIEDTYEDL